MSVTIHGFNSDYTRLKPIYLPIYNKAQFCSPLFIDLEVDKLEQRWSQWEFII